MKKYKDKNWLFNKYWNKELNIPQIAEICEVSNLTIRYWMIKFNISIRSVGEANSLKQVKNHCKLSRKAIEWISGELLGDGSLNCRSLHSARFRYSSKHFEYIQYIANILKSFGIEGGEIKERYHKERNYYSYSHASYAYAELFPIYKHWYPNGKKIVPKDIKLTSLTCRQWVIGDGCLRHDKRGGRPYIVLFTCGFLISDVKRLIKKLINLGFKITRLPSINSIRISAHSTKDFLNFIGKCPVQCYQYKFATKGE
jgi:hypothetical protein